MSKEQKKCEVCDDGLCDKCTSPTKPDAVKHEELFSHRNNYCVCFKPDTEEWEKEFGDEFINEPFDHSWNMNGVPDNIKDFIRQEKEKSYQEGRRSVFGEENYTDGLYKGLEDGRHSAYSEIIDMVEGMKHNDDCKEMRCSYPWNDGLNRLLSKLKEKLIQK